MANTAESTSTAPDMSVEFAGLRLKNPVIAASGTFGYGIEFESLVDLNELGGLVVKGLSREPMAGNSPPRLIEMPSGLLNSIGLQNVGVDAFVRDKLPRLRAFHTAVIANVFGEAVEDYVEVASRLESAEGLTAYELNLSCPNTKRGGIAFGSDPASVQEVTLAVRKVCRRLLLVKLSPNVADIVPLAQAAEAAGADALSLINTVVTTQERPETGRMIPGGKGGLSGPVIHGQAVRMVHQAARAVRIPVIGIGGILCGADAAEFLCAGAVAVEVGTANFYDPQATLRIVRELEAHCKQLGIRRVSELRD